MAGVPSEESESTIQMPCKIVALRGEKETYGKFQESAEEVQIVLEWEYWMSTFSLYTNEIWTSNQDLMNYMQTPGIED